MQLEQHGIIALEELSSGQHLTHHLDKPQVHYQQVMGEAPGIQGQIVEVFLLGLMILHNGIQINLISMLI
jgi:hypothetical protein